MRLSSRLADLFATPSFVSYRCPSCDDHFSDALPSCPDCDEELEADETPLFYWGPM